MPRKRKARVASTRAKPRVPDGDEGKDLELELKREKLATLLKDFDMQMKSFYANIKENLVDYERGLECVYTMEIARVPKFIRDMSLDDYMHSGGELNSTQLLVSDKVAQDIATDLEKDMGLTALTTSKKRKRGAKQTTTDGSETITKTTTRGKKNQLTTSVSETSVMPPPSTARPTRRTRQKDQFTTPAQFAGPSARGWETPLITPKFDPRLPVTPAMSRQPKKGEVLLSLAGSPVSNAGGNKQEKSTKARAVVHDVLKDLENVNLPDYSQATGKFLKTLRERLMQIPLSPIENSDA